MCTRHHDFTHFPSHAAPSLTTITMPGTGRIISIDSATKILRSVGVDDDDGVKEATLPHQPVAIALSPTGKHMAIATHESTLIVNPDAITLVQDLKVWCAYG